MSMTEDMLRRMRADDARLRQTETKEVPIYDTGSWTPTFVGSTIAGTFTYVGATTLGRYTRIGNQIFIHGSIQISAIAVAPTGSIQIGGLPIAGAVIANLFGAVTFGFISNFNYTNTAFDLVASVPQNGGTLIVLFESFDNAAGATVPAANFTNANCYLVFSGQYQV